MACALAADCAGAPSNIVSSLSESKATLALLLLLPAFLRNMQERKDPRQGPTTLVMAPPRELAQREHVV